MLLPIESHNSDHLQNPCAAQVWTVPLARYASPFGMGHVLRKHMNDPTMSLMDMPQRRRWYVRPRRFLSRRTCWTMKVEAQRERKPVHLGAMAMALATGEKPDMVADDKHCLCASFNFPEPPPPRANLSITSRSFRVSFLVIPE